MFPRIRGVRHIEDYRLELAFSDNTTAELDFRPRVVGRGGVVGALADLDFFRQVTVDLEGGTVVWPNGVDFCPDVLYAEATGKAIPKIGVELERVSSTPSVNRRTNACTGGRDPVEL
jgi:hypothetical protein